jgi:hypothetical protein
VTGDLVVLLDLEQKRERGHLPVRYDGDRVGPGRAEFSDVPAGTYWVIVEVAGKVRDSRKIAVKPNEAAEPVKFVLKRD